MYLTDILIVPSSGVGLVLYIYKTKPTPVEGTIYNLTNDYRIYKTKPTHEDGTIYTLTNGYRIYKTKPTHEDGTINMSIN